MPTPNNPSGATIPAPSPAVAQIAQLQAQSGSADWSRWTQNRWTFYDYAMLAPAGGSKLQFFNIPLGQPDPNVTTYVKSYEDTNLNEVRSFGRINFLLKQIRVHIRILPLARQSAGIRAVGTSLYDAANYALLTDYLLTFSRLGVLLITIGQKEYVDIDQPCITCPPGFGLDIIQHAGNSVATVDSRARWFQQDNCPGSIYTMQPEQLIEAGQNFQTNISYDNANYGALTNLMTGGTTTPLVQVGVLFDGFVLRPVQ